MLEGNEIHSTSLQTAHLAGQSWGKHRHWVKHVSGHYAKVGQ